MRSTVIYSCYFNSIFLCTFYNLCCLCLSFLDPTQNPHFISFSAPVSLFRKSASYLYLGWHQCLFRHMKALSWDLQHCLLSEHPVVNDQSLSVLLTLYWKQSLCVNCPVSGSVNWSLLKYPPFVTVFLCFYNYRHFHKNFWKYFRSITPICSSLCLHVPSTYFG